MADRFWSKVRRTDSEQDCWPWIAYIDHYGYGTFRVGGKKKKAHRVAYELLRGPIPDGLVLDHLCRNRACVNPGHLEPVTSGENTRRAAESMVECVNGHPLTAENTTTRTDGLRRCLPCRRAVGRASWHRRKDGAA